MNWQLAFFLAFIVCLALSQPAAAETEKGMFHERDCDKTGTCNLVLHSAPQRVMQDGKWVEAVRTDYVNGSWVIYTEIDWDTYMWVKEIDKNGNIVLCRNVSEAYRNRLVPIKTGKDSFSIIQEPNKELCGLYASSAYDSFEFGEHSTTIYLDGDSGWGLEDSEPREADPDVVQTGVYLRIQYEDVGSAGRRVIWKWNISGQIPAGQQVDLARMETQIKSYLEAGDTISGCIHRVSNHLAYNISGLEWNDGIITWNNMPNEAHEYNTTADHCDTFDDSWNYGWYNWTVTDSMSYAYSNGDENLSLVMIGKNLTCNEVASSDYISIPDFSIGGREPRLYITYSAAAPPGDTTDPVVTLNAPADITYQNAALVTFNCTASDDINLVNVTLYHNNTAWGANVTNSSGTNATDYVFAESFPEGSYVWNCYACDNSSNCAFGAANWTFTIDSTSPDLLFIADTLANASSTQNESWIEVNVSSTEAVSACFLNWWNDSTNKTMTIAGDTLSALSNQTGLINQTTYGFDVYCNDTSDNWNHTEYREVTINTTNIACTPSWTNTSWAAYQNTSCNISDQLVNWSYLIMYDANGCGGANTTYWDNHTLSCNYCSYNLTNTSVTDEGNTTPVLTNGSCNASGQLDYQWWNWTWWTWWIRYDSNATTCCGVTGIGADCFTNVTYYDNTSYSNVTYGVNCTYTPPITYDMASVMVIRNLDLDFHKDNWLLPVLFVSNIRVEGCIRYNCSQSGGCVTLGVCI